VRIGKTQGRQEDFIMSKTIRRVAQGMVGLAGGLGALLLGTPSAQAVAPVSIQLTRAYGGAVESPLEEGLENESPGHEMVHPVWVEKDGKIFVVIAYMSGDIPESMNAPSQMKCSSFELTESGPVLIADQVYLTENENVDRAGNYTKLLKVGSNIVFGYGYAPNNNQTRSYVRLINEQCQSVSDTLKISNNDDQNIGAVHLGLVSDNKFFATYYSNDGNESRGRFVTIENGALVKANNINLLNPTNIGRAPVATSGDRVLTCTGLGNQRPPEYGIGCTYLNSVSGEIVWKNELIVEADPENDIRYNQAQVVNIGPGRYAVMAQMTNAMGKDTNDKGLNIDQLWILEPTDQGPNVRAHTEANGIYSTHASLLTGMYGDLGEQAIGIFEAPPTPSGNAVVSFLKYDPASLSFKMDAYNDRWIVSPLHADSAMLSNLYGNNPQTQGRNYLWGIGDVPNPGFGKVGGFMPEAETLFVMPFAGKGADPSEPKLAAWVSFLPGKTSKPVVPENPEPTQKDAFNPQGVQPGTPQGTGNTGTPAPDFEPTPSAPIDEEPAVEAKEQAGGCSTNGSSSSSGLAAFGLALLGLAAARRRKS